ncbi:MAG: MBL fold metallo-hydrolase [Clostridiales Family XIII bacterium]|jgi:ribonuclease BN (tRNA processing enzyme)|nr:MBL fold metallo-hydrolase [Clostridiales Family XIII bacterium]
MKIIRDFVPIGQGGFTIETFNPAGRQFVFDCGSITSEDILNHEIHDHFFDDKARESAVFLSHMHEDHINGVTELLKHANVTDIYVPFRTYEAIAFDFFRYMSDREKR